MYYLFKVFLSLFHKLKGNGLNSKAYETKHIARLSPVYPDDYNDEEYGVYSDYLKKAFEDSNIRNIAITGNYGIGKSSFIKKWSKKKKYLFVSLCSFSEKSSKNLECDLLQQLLLGCGYIANGNNQLERKSSIMKKIIVLVLGFSISATLYFLLFFDLFNPFLVSVIDPILKMLHLSVPIQVVDKIKGVAYLLFSIAMPIGLCILIYNLVIHYRLTKMAFKIEHAEIEAECDDILQTSYMDRYRLDLIYALRKAAGKLDYTIVFEDMDRLSLDDCRSLFTELREINRLVNIHSLIKCPKKIIRFIYVIHDAVFFDKENSQNTQDQYAHNHNQDQLMHLKFFDYIMPIVPSMIEKSSLNYVTNSFENVDFRHTKFINEIAVHLSDYRLIKDITNEYAILKDVYLTRNALSSLPSDDELHLMALVIYKVLLPSDYKKIREKTSAVFYPNCDSKADTIKSEAVKCLQNNAWLSYQCLKFVGYDICETKKYIEGFFCAHACIDDDNNQIRRKMLREDFELCSEIITSKLDRNEDITACLSSVCYTLLKMVLETNTETLFLNLLKKIPNFDSQNLEPYDQDSNDTLCQFMRISFDDEDRLVDKLSIVMNYLYKINHKDYHWFFVKNNDNSNVILDRVRCRIICNFDERLLENFVQRANIRLVKWFNEFDNNTGLPRYWDTYCQKDTARILRELKTVDEISNYFNSIY